MALPFTGSLNGNININQSVITGALKNMIISQKINMIDVADTELADYFRVDGTLYGDTKLFYSADIGAPFAWADDVVGSADRLAPNLLEVNRNKSVVCQSVKMGVYKFVSISTDQYLSKNAFMNEGVFGEMMGVFSSMLGRTKKVYDRALINSLIGVTTSPIAANNITVARSLSEDALEKTKAESLNVMKAISLLKAKLKDNSREFNELNYLRSYNFSDFIAIWNVDQKANIMDIAKPITFHEGGIGETGLKEFELTGKWFGTLNSTNALSSATVRCAKAGWYDVSKTVAAYVADYTKATDAVKATCIYLNEADVIPAVGAYIDAARGIEVTIVSTTFPANYSYTVDSKVILKLVHKDSLPFMSGFESGSEFWNPLAKITTQYLMYGHNNLEFLKEYPLITISFAS